MKHSYEDANSNVKELESHLNYFINDMSQVYILINEKASEMISEQDKIISHNADILDQIDKIKNIIDSVREETSEAHISNNQLTQDLQSSLDYSLFMVSKLDSHLQLSIDNLVEQNEDLRNQNSMVFEEIFELFLKHLNESGQIALGSFEAALDLSLNMLHQKLNQTEKSIDNLNTKVSELFQFGESLKKYASSFVNIPGTVKNLFNDRIKQIKAFGNAAFMGLVFIFVTIILLLSSLLKSQFTKILRFTFIGIPMITGIALALIILRIMSTPTKVVDID
ncbi:nuclear fusion protein KAR5 [Candida albicans SC5314]|uniref:Nuclear fusion protein KAR5 n=1 Tax=Candida albicans P78048 TaxID=1094989 RepID=A0AB34PMH9_CANAX|nr:nuclear fusion protein KAR5 [Candida albicans P78048]KHC73255.1 nuclear fusion protein KAR5 [Candida albicans SC5314]KHC84929.1 nuclear fusion protein KAR5 [Candida albicans SC5314]